MVKFNTGENGPGWHVVEKFWPLVKECCVIFVSFHDGVRASANIIITTKVFQYSSHHETGIKACYGQDPGQKR